KLARQVYSNEQTQDTLKGVDMQWLVNTELLKRAICNEARNLSESKFETFQSSSGNGSRYSYPYQLRCSRSFISELIEKVTKTDFFPLSVKNLVLSGWRFVKDAYNVEKKLSRTSNGFNKGRSMKFMDTILLDSRAYSDSSVGSLGEILRLISAHLVSMTTRSRLIVSSIVEVVVSRKRVDHALMTKIIYSILFGENLYRNLRKNTRIHDQLDLELISELYRRSGYSDFTVGLQCIYVLQLKRHFNRWTKDPLLLLGEILRLASMELNQCSELYLAIVTPQFGFNITPLGEILREFSQEKWKQILPWRDTKGEISRYILLNKGVDQCFYRIETNCNYFKIIYRWRVYGLGNGSRELISAHFTILKNILNTNMLNLMGTKCNRCCANRKSLIHGEKWKQILELISELYRRLASMYLCSTTKMAERGISTRNGSRELISARKVSNDEEFKSRMEMAEHGISTRVSNIINYYRYS
ncbi:hypothetical protein L9F63_024464, partial [Diploptera punctata]